MAQQALPAWFDPAWFDPAWFQGVDRAVPWRPRWRVRIVMQGVTRYFATATMDRDASQSYDGRIAEGHEPQISKQLGDAVIRALDTQTVTFGLVNADGTLTAAYDADPRGNAVEVERYDEETAYALSRFTGQVTRAALSPTLLEIEAKSLKRAVLEQSIPAAIITTTLFPEAPAESLGHVIPIAFGTVTNVPLFCVVDDIPGGRFIYLAPLAAGGGALTINAARREGVGDQQFANIGGGDYTVNTALYPGYTVLVFPVRQTRHNSTERHNLWADVSTVSADRNFARARRHILTMPWAGLNQSVNAASWDAAITALDAVGGLFCDGVLTEQRQASDVLEQLGMARGLMLGLNELGEWTETVDTARAVALTLRDGTGDGLVNLAACEERARIAEEDRTRTLIVRYRRDLIDGTYRYEQTRTVTAGRGKDRILEHDFIRDHTTADKVAHYLKGRIAWSENTLRVVTLQEGRALDVGDLVSVTFAPMNLSAAIYEVRGLDDRLMDLALDLQGGTQAAYDAIYAYVAGTLPSDGPAGFATDYSRTAPNAATALSIASSGVRQDKDGKWSAFVVLAFTAPTTNLLHSIPRVRVNGQADWTTLGPVTGTGALTVEIPNLVSAQFYDYAIRTVNSPGTLTTDSAALSNQQAPTDSGAPVAVVVSVVLGTGSMISLDWPDSAAGDISRYLVARDLAPFSIPDGDPPATRLAAILAKQVGVARSSRFDDAYVTQNILYYYRVYAVDLSGNIAPQSNQVSATPLSGAQGATPGTPNAPTLVATGTYQASDGGTYAFARVTKPALPAGAAHVFILARLKQTPALPWTVVDGPDTDTERRLEPGIPGLVYEAAAQAINAFGLLGAVSGVLEITAPGDGTAPGTPSSIAVRDQQAKSIRFGWTNPADTDLSEIDYQVRSALSVANAAGAGSLLASGKVGARTSDVTLNLDALTYGTTYHFRVRAKDYTGNPTTADGAGALWSATISFVLNRLSASANVGAGTVTAPELGTDAVTNPAIGAGAVDTAEVAANAITQVSTVSNINDPSHTQSGTEAESQVTSMSMSKTLKLAGSPVLVNAVCVAAKLSNANVATRDCKLILSVKRGSSYLSAARLELQLPVNAYTTIPVTQTTIDSPGSVGPHTYTLNVQVDDGNVGTTNATGTLGACYLQATELAK